MENISSDKKQIVIVSNRLPVVVKKAGDGIFEIERGAGGLVTAMEPVLKESHGTWIGWPGYTVDSDTGNIISDALKSISPGYRIKPVMLNSYELENYYEGFSNTVLWPLFHGFTDKCLFRPEYWDCYRKVNARFAEVACRETKESDFLWIHDYQLLLVGQGVRRHQRHNRMGFFLHIPFPAVEVFSRCPWRYELLSALLEYDVVGFQTIQHKRNFISCISRFIREADINGKDTSDETVSEIEIAGRIVRIGVFPISIDYDEFFQKAWDNEVSKKVKIVRRNGPETQMLLGVDRLDYSKGIPEKLKAFKRFLTRYPEYHQKVYFIQIVVPSRREILAYADLKLKIEQLVGEINGMFSTNNWIPVHYMFRSLDRSDLISLYRACEIAYITPLKDGMNLVAKEYCACNISEKGVLIMSEFAGAAQQFHKDAVLVNPHDTDGVVDAIHQALTMSLAERNLRMRSLRENVRIKNVSWWLNSFLTAAAREDLHEFPLVEEYLPGVPKAGLSPERSA